MRRETGIDLVNAAPASSLSSTWSFKLLHAAALLVALPCLAVIRLSPSRWRTRAKESLFDEANGAVLTALGFAYMA